jgi:hypothetical protein
VLSSHKLIQTHFFFQKKRENMRLRLHFDNVNKYMRIRKVYHVTQSICFATMKLTMFILKLIFSVCMWREKYSCFIFLRTEFTVFSSLINLMTYLCYLCPLCVPVGMMKRQPRNSLAEVIISPFSLLSSWSSYSEMGHI